MCSCSQTAVIEDTLPFNLPIQPFIIDVGLCFQDMTYDLGDAAKWEFLFPTMDKPLLGLPAMDEGNLDLDEDEVRVYPKTRCVSEIH